MTIHRRYIFLLGLLLVCNGGYSQGMIDSIVSRFERSSAGKPTELTYFQLSKGVYETGEDLWFKAYQLSSQTFGLSDKSQTLYLQMVNSSDSVVWREKYPIERGIVSGHIYVDEKLAEGDYFLQGYAKCSFYKNDTMGVIAARKVKIVKNISRLARSQSPRDTTFRFEMFAEGGDLVWGVPSKLAFKATDGPGVPTEVKGTIYQDDEPLCEVKSVHDGMGAVLFTPLEGKKYRVELNNGRTYPLPTPLDRGVALRLAGRNEVGLDFLVTQSRGLPNEPIYLMGQMRGAVCCVAKGVLKDSLAISIPLDNFADQGIAQFTLFDGSMRPLAERLVYLHPDRRLEISVETDKKNFVTREQGTLKIKVTSPDGAPVRAHLGLSIYDKAYTNPDDQLSILAYCYLSSQIRGRIYNPSYYFDPKSSGRTEAMDLLLLTQGWRRYVWGADSSLDGGQPFLTDEINGVQTTKSRKRSERNRGTEQFIQISGAEGNSQFVVADSAGRFTIGTEAMKGLRGGYVYLKSMLDKEFKPKIYIEDLFLVIDSIRAKRADTYPMVYSGGEDKAAPFVPLVSLQDRTIMLDEVVVNGRGRKPFRDKFLGRLDSMAQMNLGPWVCIHGYLENYRDGYSHLVGSASSPTQCAQSSGDTINVKRKPIIGRSYYALKYEPKGANNNYIMTDKFSVIYQGALYSEEELLRMNGLWRTNGYYADREFYVPDELDMKSSAPDARNTLLWQPTVITDEKGEATVSFYCSDINTQFTGVVEGVDGVGLLGAATCEFRVLKSVAAQ